VAAQQSREFWPKGVQIPFMVSITQVPSFRTKVTLENDFQSLSCFDYQFGLALFYFWVAELHEFEHIILPEEFSAVTWHSSSSDHEQDLVAF
jgi:hypothetical protein